MKRRTMLTVMLAAVLIAGSVSTVGADESKLVESNALAGVPRPYTGATNAVKS